jgi:hypothetical protein
MVKQVKDYNQTSGQLRDTTPVCPALTSENNSHNHQHARTQTLSGRAITISSISCDTHTQQRGQATLKREGNQIRR